MLLRAGKPKDEYMNLTELPMQKMLLDYLCEKITARCSPEKSQFVNELFELHRTSNGFDPHNLIKTRFLRLKASELKMLLKEINGELATLYADPEYKKLYADFYSGDALYEKMNMLRKKMSVNDYSDIETVAGDFKQQVLVTDAYQIALAFFKFCHNKQAEPSNSNAEPRILEERE
jgi:hypothetical protein